jgi:DNA-binding MarR family transcriptional regulator
MGASHLEQAVPAERAGHPAAGEAAVNRRLFAAFLRAAALVEPLNRDVAARAGVSLADLHAVRVLQLSGVIPVSRLGAELGLPRSTVTNLVARRERSGLVERVPSGDDRRVPLVRPSPAGADALESFATVRESEAVRRLLALDLEDRVRLGELLERLTGMAEASA